MHCELLIPALLAPNEAIGDLRLPALELLLARARRTNSDEEESAGSWLARAFLRDEGPLPAGALTVLADGGEGHVEPAEALWLRADPIHLGIEGGHATLVPSAALGISRDEAASLCETLNAHFAGEMTIHPLHAECWSARLDAPIAPPVARSPLELARLPIKEHLPTGEAAQRWHGLLNESQMLLHNHPVNAARETRGAPAINSLWFWGAGRLPEHAATHWQSVTADDPVAAGLARLAGVVRRTLPHDAAKWLAGAPAAGVHLLMLDALQAPQALGDLQAAAERLRELEDRWFAPLYAALRAGRLGMITLRLPDAGGASYEVTRADLRRFWRRARPLATYLRD